MPPHFAVMPVNRQLSAAATGFEQPTSVIIVMQFKGGKSLRSRPLPIINPRRITVLVSSLGLLEGDRNLPKHSKLLKSFAG